MKTITIRHMPDELRQKLKERAAAAGLSLNGYLVLQLKRLDAELRLERKLARLLQPPKANRRPRHLRTPVTLTTSAAEVIREHRGPIS